MTTEEKIIIRLANASEKEEVNIHKDIPYELSVTHITMSITF